MCREAPHRASPRRFQQKVIFLLRFRLEEDEVGPVGRSQCLRRRERWSEGSGREGQALQSPPSPRLPSSGTCWHGVDGSGSGATSPGFESCFALPSYEVVCK